jgi:hypothetical protein
VHVFVDWQTSSVGGIDFPRSLQPREFSEDRGIDLQKIHWILCFGISPVAHRRGYGVAFICAAHDCSGNVRQATGFERKPTHQNWVLPFHMRLHTLAETDTSFSLVANEYSKAEGLQRKYE